MQNSEEKRNIELNSKQKSGWIKIALVVVIAAAAVYGYRTWSGGKAVQQQTAQAFCFGIDRIVSRNYFYLTDKEIQLILMNLYRIKHMYPLQAIYQQAPSTVRQLQPLLDISQNAPFI